MARARSHPPRSRKPERSRPERSGSAKRRLPLPGTHKREQVVDPEAKEPDPLRGREYHPERKQPRY